jgi:uracil phosphoribosyltransferase
MREVPQPAPVPEAANLRVVGGPLISQKLAVLRDERTDTPNFRQAMRELALIMVAEATREMPTRRTSIQTPLAETEVEQISAPVCVVPVLRAGLGMLDGALALLPRATVGFMGLFRDEETAQPVEYYVNLPSNLQDYLVLVLDPMLATGGSLSATLNKLKEEGANWISCLHAVAAVPGVERLTAEHPDVTFYAAAVDPALDERSFIVPGLGDAGDRLYGTL